MRYAARELPDALQPPGLMELLQQGSLSLAVGPLGNVANRRRGEQALRGLDARDADLGRKLASVLAHGGEHQGGARWPRARLGEVGGSIHRMRVATATRNEDIDLLAEQLAARISEKR